MFLVNRSSSVSNATRRAPRASRQLRLPVVVGFVSLLIDRVPPASTENIEAFHTDLATGAKLPEGDPVLTLRARILS